MKSRLITVALLGYAMFTCNIAQASLITNGSFEGGNFVQNQTTGVGEFNLGSTVITGWEVIQDELHWMNNTNPYGLFASNGNYFLDLTAFQNDITFGGVRQTVATEIGATYSVSFDIGSSANFSNGQVSSVSVSAGAASQIFNVGVVNTNNHWASYSYSFIANSISTQLAFTGNYNTSLYVGLDNIGLVKTANAPDPTKAPEPSTLSIFSICLIGLALRRLKKQR